MAIKRFLICLTVLFFSCYCYISYSYCSESIPPEFAESEIYHIHSDSVRMFEQYRGIRPKYVIDRKDNNVVYIDDMDSPNVLGNNMMIYSDEVANDKSYFVIREKEKYQNQRNDLDLYLTKIAYIDDSVISILWQKYLSEGYKSISSEGFLVNINRKESMTSHQSNAIYSLDFYDNNGNILTREICDYYSNIMSCPVISIDTMVPQFGWSNNGERFFLVTLEAVWTDDRIMMNNHIRVYDKYGSKIFDENIGTRRFVDVKISDTGQFLIYDYRQTDTNPDAQNKYNACITKLISVDNQKSQCFDFGFGKAYFTSYDKAVILTNTNKDLFLFDLSTNRIKWSVPFNNQSIYDLDSDDKVIALIYRNAYTSSESNHENEFKLRLMSLTGQIIMDMVLVDYKFRIIPNIAFVPGTNQLLLIDSQNIVTMEVPLSCK